MSHKIDAYAMYLRKSRADLEAEARGEGETLARHRRALTELAERRRLAVVHVYEEIVTGDSISSRPQMQALLAAVERGEYAGVIVNDADRLARGDSIDQGIIKQAFYSTGTLIITPFKTYDPSNIADEDYFDFSLFMARFEYKMIKRRLQTGRMRSASEGNYLGSRPVYGYRRVKRGDRSGWTLEIDPEKSQIIRSIFEWYAHGDESGKPLGANSIANKLNALGLRTDLGCVFDGGRVRGILQNRVYIGEVSWAKRVKQVRATNGQRTEIRAVNPDPIIVKNAHDAIIDPDLFNEVQRMFATHAKLPKNELAPVRNALAGLIRCPKCGRCMQRIPGYHGQPDMLRCRTYGCPTTGIYIPIAESAILECLNDWVTRYSEPQNEQADTEPEVASVERAAQRQLETLYRQRDKLYDLVEQGVYSPVDFANRRAEIMARIQAIEMERDAARNTPSDDVLIRANLPQIKHVLEAYPLTTDQQLKNQLLRSVISRIDYEKTHRCNRGENPADYLTLRIYPTVLKNKNH